MNKRLIYILNLVNEHDSQHFVHVLRLLAAMQDLGWKVVVLSEKGGEGTKWIMGCEVRYLSRHGGALRLFRQIRELIRLRRQGFRLVFVRITRPAALVTALMAPILRLRGLFWLSGMILDYDKKQSRLQQWWRSIQMRFVVRQMTAFVTGPETMMRYYRDNLNVPREKMRLLYNDIDPAAFPPAPEHRFDGSRRVLRLLMVHRLSPVRQTDLYFPSILSAMEQLRAEGVVVSLDVIGGGPERPLLEAQLAGRPEKLEVVFHGAVPNVALNAYYDRADIFLMPSYREGFPRVLLEAMSKGLPIVSTDAGGVCDLLGSSQIAFMSGRDDPEQIGANILILARSPEIRAVLRQENLAQVMRFSTPQVAEEFERVLYETDNE